MHKPRSPGQVSCYPLFVVAPYRHLTPSPWPVAVLNQVQPKAGLGDGTLLVH